jgi:hypothetical protein
LIVENHVQQGTVDFDAAVVINKTQFPEFVHEKTHARSRRADHLRHVSLGPNLGPGIGGSEALAPGGTIAIAEILVDAERTTAVPALIFAVNMLVNSDQGDTFSFDEIRSWLHDAGFEQVRTVQAPGLAPLLILATKPTR